VLKTSTRVKRPSVELLQAPKGKQPRVNVTLSPAPTPIRMAIAWPQPSSESDDG
jgi:hypothetical protein